MLTAPLRFFCSEQNKEHVQLLTTILRHQLPLVSGASFFFQVCSIFMQPSTILSSVNYASSVMCVFPHVV